MGDGVIHINGFVAFEDGFVEGGAEDGVVAVEDDGVGPEEGLAGVAAAEVGVVAEGFVLRCGWAGDDAAAFGDDAGGVEEPGGGFADVKTVEG